MLASGVHHARLRKTRCHAVVEMPKDSNAAAGHGALPGCGHRVEIEVNMSGARKSHAAVCAAGVVILAILGLAACATPAQKEAKFLEAGKRYLARKDYPRAALAFRNATQVAPTDVEAQYQLAVACMSLGAYEDAVSALQKASSLNPKHVPSQLLLAELMATSRTTQVLEEARKRVEGVLATMPDNAEALTTLALTKLRLGRPEGAEQDLERALASAPASFRSSLLLARLKLSEKDTDGAERVLREAAQKAPKSANAPIALGEFYQGLRRYGEAEAQFLKAVQIDGNSGLALIDLAAVQMATGRKGEAEQTYRRAASLPGREYRASHVLFLLNEGKTDAAITELKDLVTRDRQDRDTRNLLVGAYLATNKISEATSVLSDVLAKNPKDINALMERARIRIMAGQYTEAQKDLVPVLSLQPDLAPAHHLLAKVYQAQGASGLYRQELEEALRRNPQYLGARVELASVLLSEHAAQAALTLMDQTPEPQKSNIPVIVQRNAALIGLGRSDEAAKGVEAGLKIARSPELLMQDAILRIQRKDAARARKSAEEALSIAPENVRAVDVLMAAYKAQGQQEAALKRLREHAAQHPKSVAIQQYLGTILATGGKPAEARDVFAGAKTAAPSSTGTDLNLAHLDILQGKTDEARKILTALLARDSTNATAHAFMADVELGSGNWAAAVEHYRSILGRDPRNALALNNLAYLLAERAKQPDEALKYAQQAKELAPQDPRIDDTIGWVHYYKGLYPTAVKYLEAANAKQPTAVGKYHLAMAYLKTGNLRRGTEVLNQALKLDATLPEAATAKQVLAETGKQAAAK
jgi:tetratricopeptide (TPR) repeat protein